MPLINKSNNKIIVNDIKHCKDHLSKAIGLMFSRKINDKALVFYFNSELIQPLHMLFVFFSIDVLWLNHDKEIVEIRENLKPFVPIVVPRKKASYVIELASGVVTDKAIKVGDKIEF